MKTKLKNLFTLSMAFLAATLAQAKGGTSSSGFNAYVPLSHVCVEANTLQPTHFKLEISHYATTFLILDFDPQTTQTIDRNFYSVMFKDTEIVWGQKLEVKNDFLTLRLDFDKVKSKADPVWGRLEVKTKSGQLIALDLVCSNVSQED